MDTVALAGVGLTLVGVGGYVVGVVAPYPGRAFSLTVLMIGLASMAVGRSEVQP